MENRMKYMTWQDFDEMRKQTKTVIFPSGAFEVYGPHMPLGADTLVSQALCKLVADKANAVVGPCVEAGISQNLYGFPGTVYVRPEHLKGVYRDFVESMIKWGFKEIFVLNLHLHNTFCLNELLADIEDEYPEVNCGVVGFWQYIWKYTDVFETPKPHGHASEAGTSVLLHLMPELVDMKKAVDAPALWNDKWPGFSKFRHYDKYSVTGTMGDATKGDAAKGKIVVERFVEEAVEFINSYLRMHN